jgi:hypothetical protein
VEELLIAIIQFLCEVIAQSIGFLPFGFYPRDDYSDTSRRSVLTVAAFLGGLACGGASVFFIPHSFLHQSWLRVASLVASPLLAGAIAWWMAELRISYKPHLIPRHHFWYAFTFTLGLSLYRFTHVQH